MEFKAVSGKETKYIVVKIEDLQEYYAQFSKGAFATEEEKEYMDSIPFNEVLEGIEKIRRDNKKEISNQYIVINRDEPYADTIWNLILMFEDSKKLRRLTDTIGDQLNDLCSL